MVSHLTKTTATQAKAELMDNHSIYLMDIEVRFLLPPSRLGLQFRPRSFHQFRQHG